MCVCVSVSVSVCVCACVGWNGTVVIRSIFQCQVSRCQGEPSGNSEKVVLVLCLFVSMLLSFTLSG